MATLDDAVNLADLGKWPKVKVGNHAVVRHAYNGSLIAATRLLTFATSTLPRSEGPIEGQQTLLATDDMVAFGIHARRLIENTLSKAWAAHTLVPALAGKAASGVPITRIIDVLIHHKALYIARTIQKARILSGQCNWQDFLSINKQAIRPFCVVVSDQGKPIQFIIEDLIEIFQGRILDAIIRVCGDAGLWLDND